MAAGFWLLMEVVESRGFLGTNELITTVALASALISGPECVQEQVTLTSHAARKQPGRGAKKPSQAGTDILIEGNGGPSVHVSEVAQDEQGHNGPPFMSTQDYLEEAEELLHHPLEPNPLDTQPEVWSMQKHVWEFPNSDHAPVAAH